MQQEFTTTEYEIIDKEMLTDDVALFQIKGRLDFKPGQFVEVTMPHFGNITLAPCSNPADKKEFELCVRAVGNTSDAFLKLLPGDKINLRGPYGNGWPTNKLFRHDLIIIAGGIGFASLRSVVFDLEDKIYFSKVRIFSGFKKPEDVLFKADLQRWQKKFKVSVAVEHIDSNSRAERGMITDLIEKTRLNHQKSLVLMCGPELMYPHCVEALNRKGILSKQIYVSLERRMECGIGLCQHCSCGKYLVCHDGPVFRYDQIKDELNK
ncbi:MAG: FAD/NAD(P)-binding protein [bacterium]|nr:FAD/NAD(P)-binding protein [bacterium]